MRRFSAVFWLQTHAEVGDFISEALFQKRFEALRARLRETFQLVKREKGGMIKVGSMCSGWGTQEMISKMFQSQWNAHFPAFALKASCFFSYFLCFN